MTVEQINLFRQSMNRLSPVARSASALFYWRFSDLVPAYRPILTAQRGDEETNLLLMIANAVEIFADPAQSSFHDVTEQSEGGLRILENHTQSAADALYWTLEKALGVGFTPEVKQAWSAAYDILRSQVMREA